MTAASQYEWSSFDVHMLLPTDPGAVYEFWATSGGMERFFAHRFKYLDPQGTERPPSTPAQPGDSYWLAFHHPSELTGEILAAQPATDFAFTFGNMRVAVTLDRHERGTLLRLTQSNIPTDETGQAESHLNCRSCWGYYLLNLRSVIGHGIDLRDEGLPDNPVSIHFGERTVSKNH